MGAGAAAWEFADDGGLAEMQGPPRPPNSILPTRRLSRHRAIRGRKWPAPRPMAADLNIFKVLEHSCKLPVRVSSEGAGTMNSVIYLIGLVVVVLAILSFLGFH